MIRASNSCKVSSREALNRAVDGCAHQFDKSLINQFPIDILFIVKVLIQSANAVPGGFSDSIGGSFLIALLYQNLSSCAQNGLDCLS